MSSFLSSRVEMSGTESTSRSMVSSMALEVLVTFWCTFVERFPLLAILPRPEGRWTVHPDPGRALFGSTQASHDNPSVSLQPKRLIAKKPKRLCLNPTVSRRLGSRKRRLGSWGSFATQASLCNPSVSFFKPKRLHSWEAAVYKPSGANHHATCTCPAEFFINNQYVMTTPDIMARIKMSPKKSTGPRPRGHLLLAALRHVPPASSSAPPAKALPKTSQQKKEASQK